MSMNLIAILVSLAMMLTGAGVDGQPAEAAKTLTIHDISVTYNDETVDLDPALCLSAATDGEKAVFDLGVLLDGDTLFPVQLGADESGVTALFKGSDVAAKISADALNGLSEQMDDLMQTAQSQMAEGENAELMDYMMNEYLPAYTGLLEALQDREYLAQMQEKANEAALSVIDRGEGTPVTETYDGQEYALTEYHYTVEADQMAELVDAIYGCDEKLTAYYDAMFKMYAMMPEESGLNGITSFRDMFEKLNLSMSMELTERVSDDGEVDISEGVLVIDMNGMMQAMVEAQTEADADETASSDVPVLPPMEINIAGAKIGEHQEATVSCAYEVEDVSMDINVEASAEGEDEAHMVMNLSLAQDGDDIGDMFMALDAVTDEATGDEDYSVTFGFSAEDNDMTFSASGTHKADGECEHTFACDVNAEGNHFALSFCADVTNGAASDEANGHEAAVTIDDLSSEALNALGEDQAAQAALMQVVGSMSADSQKLMANESVQKLTALFMGVTDQPDIDDGGDGMESEEEYDYEYEEPEDDGELGYNVPEFTWLPDGWELKDTEVNTQYDWVSINAGTEDYNSSMYATFYKDYDENTVNYVVGGDGEIEAVDGREITVSDFGDGSMSITIHEENLYGNLMFIGEDIDLDTVGQIVAGIQF